MRRSPGGRVWWAPRVKAMAAPPGAGRRAGDGHRLLDVEDEAAVPAGRDLGPALHAAHRADHRQLLAVVGADGPEGIGEAGPQREGEPDRRDRRSARVEGQGPGAFLPAHLRARPADPEERPEPAADEEVEEDERHDRERDQEHERSPVRADDLVDEAEKVGPGSPDRSSPRSPVMAGILAAARAKGHPRAPGRDQGCAGCTGPEEGDDRAVGREGWASPRRRGRTRRG